MIISRDTISILEHFSKINPGIHIEPGNRIYTKAISNTIRSVATVEENFEHEFSIANLGLFVHALEFFIEPDLDFSEEGTIKITSSDGSQTITYAVSDPALVEQDNKNLKTELLESVIKFTLTKDNLSKILKGCALFGCSDICVFSEDGFLYISCYDKSVRAKSNAYKLCLGEYSGAKIEMFFRRDTFKLTPNDFEVEIMKTPDGSKAIAIFKAIDTLYDVMFYISPEASYTIG